MGSSNLDIVDGHTASADLIDLSSFLVFWKVCNTFTFFELTVQVFLDVVSFHFFSFLRSEWFASGSFYFLAPEQKESCRIASNSTRVGRKWKVISESSVVQWFWRWNILSRASPMHAMPRGHRSTGGGSRTSGTWTSSQWVRSSRSHCTITTVAWWRAIAAAAVASSAATTTSSTVAPSCGSCCATCWSPYPPPRPSY